MYLPSAMMQISWINAMYLVICTLTIFFIYRAIYNSYWHPLAKYPGPRFFAISRVPYAFCHISGKLAVTFHALHKEYGPVVRTAPNELSFIEPEALRTIYAERTKLCPVFKKNYDAFNETRNQIAHSVFIAGDSDHARMRKIINHAFSERALRDQEPRIQSQVQTLILGLDSARTKTGIVDLNEWYNCAAFDIIADAAFGEPFNTLQEPTYRSWLYLIGMTWKAITFASAIKSIAPRLYIFRRLIPTGRMLQKEVDKFNLILDRVRERMVVETGRIDLLSLVMKNNTNEKEKMTDQEVISNATLFVAAGTETVTTLLSALTYLLTRHGRIMKKLSEEIRNSFLNESLITVQSVSQLQYLTACIQEALRLFPPIPEGLPRVVPSGGEDICGQRIPGGTFVQVSNLAASLSPSNFTDPESFIPERWLGIDPRFSADKKQASQPFSVGPRNCVGQSLAMAEMRLIMTRILWRFDLQCHLKDEWMDVPTYLLWEKKPLPIELIPVREC